MSPILKHGRLLHCIMRFVNWRTFIRRILDILSSAVDSYWKYYCNVHGPDCVKLLIAGLDGAKSPPINDETSSTVDSQLGLRTAVPHLAVL